jgi:succinate dehydrogenase / fumarate reductase cytochrome b subunit
MGWLKKTIDSSIGKKLVMSLTGLALYGFILAHLAGNMLLYVGENAFNDYANALSSTKLIYLAEALLILICVTHVIFAIRLSIENRSARPVRYAMDVSAGERTFMSSHMIHTGMVILIFIIIHLVTFKYGEWSNAAGSSATLYDLVVMKFQNPYYSGFYVVAMVLLGMHLNHAFQSAFQTLGLNHKKHTPNIKKLGALLSVIITAGFSSFPIFFFFIKH